MLWIGTALDTELSLARAWAGEVADVVDVDSIAAAVSDDLPCFASRSPAVVLFASPTPGRWSPTDGLAVSHRWPLAPLASVAGTLVEGRRRSGPGLPGIEEVAWNELPGRMAWWIHDRARGRPGGLGMPTTARREERLLEAAERVAEFAAAAAGPVSIAASRAADLEPLADLVTAAGRPPGRRTVGRPPLDDSADVLVWDVSEITATDLTWLAMLTANRPRAAVVLLDSFPRGDTTRAAVDAGARAVLPRPLSLETLSGVLLRLQHPDFGAPACG